MQAAEGISILDFTWMAAGPITTKYLADNGANVVRVESSTRPDMSRLGPPWKDGQPGINRSQFYGSYNSSKKSICLDMKMPEARDIVRRLVPHFDGVTENFTPGVMAKWGLSYADLCELKPDIVMLSMCMQGQTGPHAQYPGFGSAMGALSGFYHMSGYSDDQIAPPYGAYTDYVIPRIAAFALLSALDYRRRTGEGQYIDLSQYEASLHFLAPILIDFMSSGNNASPKGNWSERYAPHGAYRFADEGGEERWVAVAVENDEQWVKVLAILGESSDPRFETIVNRIECAEILDEFVQELVRHRDAQTFVVTAQREGIGAYPVQSCLDLHSDANLLEFGFWRWLEQAEVGVMPYDGLSYRLDRTGSAQSAAPSQGADTEEVLESLLGMSVTEMRRLKNDGVLR